tara:strand:- start:211 stop:825 length:615 start_codon:yes stop_codon:yes gene_type:complete
MTTTPKLSFTAETWQQLNYMCKRAPTEIGCFAITHPEDRLFVTDLWFPKQTCTAATVEFDDEDIAAQIDELADTHPMDECFRIWIHTHPGNSANPSGTDESTFSKVLGHFDWAVMAILAKGGETYARIKHNAPAGITDGKIEYKIPMGMYSGGYEEWDKILEDKVTEQTFAHTTHKYPKTYYGQASQLYRDDWYYDTQKEGKKK